MSNESLVGGTTTTPATTSTTDLGVVNQLRVPGAAFVGRAWRRLPMLGRVFVAAAALDILVRVLRLGGLSLSLDLDVPISLVSAFVPHSLLIVFPALLLLRRPDAATATPLVVRGAVVLALAELLIRPFANIGVPVPGLDPIVAGMGIGIVATVMNAAAWLALGIGLIAVTASRPGPTLAGLTNLVLIALVAAAFVELVGLLVFPYPELGDPAWTSTSMLSTAMFLVESVAFGFLAWVVVGGTNDVRRPAGARYLATIALVINAAIAAAGAIVGVIAIVQVAFAIPVNALAGSVAFAWLGGWTVATTVLVAFALGLADPSVRIGDREGPLAADPEPIDVGPSWPTPGGEVPTYHVLEPATQGTTKAPRAKRGRSKESKA